MPPHRRSEEEREELLRELQGAGNKFTREQGDIDHAIERANHAYTLVKWLVGGIVIVTLFAAKLYWTQQDHGERIKADALTLEADAKVIQDLRETIRANRAERQASFDAMTIRIVHLEAWIDKWDQAVRDMDYMRRAGKSNKEDFLERNHYQAPDGPTK